MSQPVVASYCTTFLKREMLHVYRQVTGLKTFRTFVMTKSRENPDLYPFDDIEILPRPRINFLARFHKKYIRRMEPVFYRGEYDHLNGILTRRKADLLHVYFGHTGVHLLPFIRHWPKPTVVSFHGMDIMPRPHEPGYDDRLRMLLETLPLVMARSESLAARLEDLGCDRAKIRINRTALPMDGFPFHLRPQPKDGAWRFLQACRFIPKKGLEVTLEAFAGFQKKNPRATLVLAGEGPLLGDLKKQVAALGLNGSVDFPGFYPQDELVRAFRAAHVFLHPSRTTAAGDQEGVPNSMLEAMATGLPVAATRHGGIPEAVTSGQDGILVAEDDAPALQEALFTLTRDPAQYEQFGKDAASSVREKFGLDRSIANLESIYGEAMEKVPG